eukprot:1058932-Pelagomonas_calceolata.AAC.5
MTLHLCNDRFAESKALEVSLAAHYNKSDRTCLKRARAELQPASRWERVQACLPDKSFEDMELYLQQLEVCSQVQYIAWPPQGLARFLSCTIPARTNCYLACKCNGAKRTCALEQGSACNLHIMVSAK